MLWCCCTRLCVPFIIVGHSYRRSASELGEVLTLAWHEQARGGTDVGVARAAS